MDESLPDTPQGTVRKMKMLFPQWQKGAGCGASAGSHVKGDRDPEFSSFPRTGRNGRWLGSGISCWILVSTICSNGKVTEAV